MTRTAEQIIDDLGAGRIERSEVKIVEKARLDKFEMTDNGRVLVETIEFNKQDGLITDITRTAHTKEG